MALLVGGSTLNKDKLTQNMLLKGNVANDITLAWSEPAAARTLTIPDPGAAANFVFDNRTVSTSTGLTGGGALSANLTLSVVADSVVERIRVDSGGTVTGTRPELNFIQGSNVTLTVADNAVSNRVDVTIASSTASVGANPAALVGLAAVNGVATTFLRSDGAPALDQTIAPTWTGLHTFNPGTTPSNAVYLSIAAPAVAGTRNSHNLLQRGASFDTLAHTTDWQHYVAITSNAGASTMHFQSRIDAGAFADRLTIDDGGNLVVPGNLTVSGTTTTISSTTLTVADKNVDMNYGGTTTGAAGGGPRVLGTSNAVVGALLFNSTPPTKFQIGDGTTMYDVVGATSTQTLTNKTLTTPTIGDFTNATHTHQTVAGGGTLDGAAIATGTVVDARLSTNVALLNNAQTFTGAKTFNALMTLGDALTQSDGLAAGKNATLGNLGTATSVATGFGSQTMILNGSSWTGTAAQAHQFQLFSSITDQNTSKVVIAKKIGAGSVTNVASIDQNGNMTLLGTITEKGTP